MCPLISVNESGQFVAAKPSSQPSANPTNPNPNQAAKKLGSNWDARVHSKAEDMLPGYNYDSTKMIRKAYDGKYYGVIKDVEEKNPELAKNLKKFQDYSYALGKELEKDQPDVDLIENYRAKASDYQVKVVSAFRKAGNNSAWRLNEETGDIMDSKTYRKKSQDPIEFENESSIDTRVSKNTFGGFFSDWVTELAGSLAGAEPSHTKLVDPTPGYNQLKSVDKRHRDGLRVRQSEYVGMWLNNAIEHGTGNSKAVEFNQKSAEMSEKLLTFVSKYGTTVDRDMTDRDKKFAAYLNKQLKLAENSRNAAAEKAKILRENRDGIVDLSKRIGYDGTNYLFNTYKKEVGYDEAFYDYDVNRPKEKMVNALKYIDKLSNNYAKYKNLRQNIMLDIEKNVETYQNDNEYFKEVKAAPKEFHLVVDKMVDANGNILSFEKWKKNLPENVRRQLYTNNGPMDRSKFQYAVDNATDQQAVITNARALEKIDNETLLNVYNNVKRGYKQTLDSRKVKLSYPNTLLATGLGGNRRSGIGYESVDLSTDENGRMLSFDSEKQQRIQPLMGLFRNPDGSFRNDGTVYFFPKNVAMNTLEKEDISNYAKKSESVAKSFFNGKREDTKMVFLRDTNLPGYALYRFEDNETKEGVQVLVNKSALGNKGIKEDFFMNSYETLEEFNMKLEGSKKMMNRRDQQNRPLLRNARIIFDSKLDAYVYEATLLQGGSPRRTRIEGVRGATLQETEMMISRQLDLLF